MWNWLSKRSSAEDFRMFTGKDLPSRRESEITPACTILQQWKLNNFTECKTVHCGPGMNALIQLNYK